MAKDSLPPNHPETTLLLSVEAASLALDDLHLRSIHLELEARAQKIEVTGAKANLQITVARWLTLVFIGINVLVIGGVVTLGVLEWLALEEGREIERLVTSEVIMTVIGATTVQLGAVVFAMARHLFPGGKKNQGEDDD